MSGARRRVCHAILQLKPLKGDPSGNLDRLGNAMRSLREAGAPIDVLVLPETALTGYFQQGGVREVAQTAEQLHASLAAVHRAVWEGPLDVAVGFYERRGTEFFNAALYAQLGGDGAGIRHVHRKVFLPTYGVFDEDRFLSRGPGFQSFQTRFGSAALLICEDAWHSVSATICALQGADLIYVLNASPVRGLERNEPANAARWRDLVAGIAAEHGVWVALGSLVGLEGGKALTGASMVAHPDGHAMVGADVLEEAILLADLDLDALQAARYDNPLLADLQSTLPRVLPSLHEALGTPRMRP